MQRPPNQYQMHVATTCPFKHAHQFATTMRPHESTTMYSRCQLCLAYWETTPDGQIIALKRPTQDSFCPKCLQPTGEAPLMEHICKQLKPV